MNKKPTKKDIKRICKNLDELKEIFDQIDKEIDASMKVSPETLRKTITI